MKPVISPHKMVIRSDHVPLRTKIVATIGSPDVYQKKRSQPGEQLIDLEGHEVPPPISYQYLVRSFYDSGVDVIRINFSHVALDQVGSIFREIKKAILECEADNRYVRQMAVLADLPGPKIRFHLERRVTLKVGQSFTVALDRGEKGHCVYVDNRPLKKAMDELDQRRQVWRDFPGEEDSQLGENIFGDPISQQAVGGLFPDLMTRIAQRIGQGDPVLVFIGDGAAVLEVDTGQFRVEHPSLPCRVMTVREPKLSGYKGFTLKGIDLDIPTFTDQDQAIVTALLDEEYGGSRPPRVSGEPQPVLAFIAVSFVQTADDLLRIRRFVENQLIEKFDMPAKLARFHSPAIVAKIETSKGWLNRDYILDVADGIMVARGDLGLQMEIEEVPGIQKRLIELCRKRGKSVITATQMLASMTDSIEPTRAEASDVFNAIQDGTDAVMTSEETAVGRYPFHTLQKMIRIADQAERYFESEAIHGDTGGGGEAESLRQERRRQRVHEFLKDDYIRIQENEERIRRIWGVIGQRMARLDAPRASREEREELEDLQWRLDLFREKLSKAVQQQTTNRITEAACTMAEASEAKAIVATSTSGRTARMISRIRPRVATVGATHDMMNARKLLISYGVIPLCIDTVTAPGGVDAVFSQCSKKITGHAYLGSILTGRTVVFTGGTPPQQPGTTNAVQILQVRAPSGVSPHRRRGSPKRVATRGQTRFSPKGKVKGQRRGKGKARRGR